MSSSMDTEQTNILIRMVIGCGIMDPVKSEKIISLNTSSHIMNR